MLTVPLYAGHIFNLGQFSIKIPGQISVQINSQIPQTRCNDFGHDLPMIAIPSADDCGSLQL